MDTPTISGIFQRKYSSRLLLGSEINKEMAQEVETKVGLEESKMETQSLFNNSRPKLHEFE